ncbi:response regulator [Aquincola sp. S2]|uniref:histidine kinase n=1 Tax=Pseudaquabacterium terrae TaxID=2732868 RepID=A0ABX2EHJ8_9BURK|nr:ATP-binding protein [Aquabacterium terrae]NRF68105.1 response regulator [Aquabacterium terrae]
MAQPTDPPPRASKRRWFEPQRNIAHRFIAYLALSSILPLLLLGFASFEISRSALRSEAERHLSQLLIERKRYVDLQTEQTEDLIANISGVEAISTGLATPFDPADNYARLSMQARMGYILNGYVNIKGLVSIDLFSERGAQYHVGDTLDVGPLRRDVLDELRRQAAASTRPVHWVGLVDNVNRNSRVPQVITAAKLLYGLRPGTAEQVPLGLLLVNYNPNYLREQFGEVAGGGAVQLALLDGAGRLMVHPDVRRVGSLVDGAMKDQLQGDAGSFLWDRNGAPALVSFRRSEPSGWPLVGFVSLEAINAHAGAIGQATALVALLCLAVAGIAAVSYSRRVVAPLRHITERFAQLRGDRALPQQHLPVQGDDDIAELSRGFNAFLDGLHERERAERALQDADAERRARLAAEAASEAKSLFLAKMSHDLRTPLNAVLGYAQILKRDKTLTARQAMGLNTIQSSGEHLLMLINDILDLSKIEAGKLELQLEDIDLAEFLRQIGDTIRVKAEEKGLAFELAAAPDLPAALRCDHKRLRQVLLNLLDNAVKFTDSGRVSLRVRPLAADPVQPALPPGIVRLRFEVEDSGVGIAPQQIEASFRPFEQVGETRRRAAGTGLGLAISRQLVRVMGGDVQVRSVPGAGTSFWFDLPLAFTDVRPQRAPPQRAATGYQGRPRRVLVIDDVAANRALVHSFLVPLGFEVFEADNGQAGVEKAQSLQPDLVLMDMFMPVMDGLEATRQLRMTPPCEAVPIISVSAIASSSDRSLSLAAGADAFLPKPIDFDALTNEVGRLLKLSWTYEDVPAAWERPGAT